MACPRSTTDARAQRGSLPHAMPHPADIVQMSRDLGLSLDLRAVDAQRQVTARTRRRIAATQSFRPFRSRIPSPSSCPANVSGASSSSRRRRRFRSVVVHLDALGRSPAIVGVLDALDARRAGPIDGGAPARRPARRRRRPQYLARPGRARRAVSRPAVPRDPGLGRSAGLGLRVLDYLFFRAGPTQRAHYRQLEQTYGSDHRPLVGWVE